METGTKAAIRTYALSTEPLEIIFFIPANQPIKYKLPQMNLGRSKNYCVLGGPIFEKALIF